MKIKINKFINMIILILLVVISLSINLYPIDGNKVTYTSGGYISQTLTEEIQESINMNEEVTISLKLDYDLLDTSNLLPPEGCSLERARELKRQRRELGRAYYTRNNNMLVQKIDGKNYKNRYVSTYLPVIEYSYTVEEFNKNKNTILSSLSTSSDVKTVDVVGSDKKVDQLSAALAKSNASSLYSSSNTYTGSGINIGVLEAGIADKDHAALTGINLTVRDEWYYVETKTDHATKIVSILAHQTGGIVPDAHIFSVEVFGNLTSELDWLVDNDVDIINMSMRKNASLGEYNDISAECDYVAKQYGVMIVAASCNKDSDNPQWKVGNPGLGYNVLTVGNHSLINELDENSGYVVVNGPAKPNLVAVGCNIGIPGYNVEESGTSASTAIMTGMITALMSQYSDLIGNPGKVMALTMASCAPVTGTLGNTETNGLNEKWGTGLFNYGQAVQGKNSIYVVNNTNTLSAVGGVLVGTLPWGFTIGKPIRISAYWQANATGNSSETSKTTYFMELYDASNKLIATSTCGSSNYMYIYLSEAITGGRYKLKIYQKGSKAVSGNENVYVCFGSNA
ncbi:peptidase S8/S53 subtilisin kexin sedolisin [Coprobacillus sp. CAG:698]|nr:peptidase S8/S53 subtilisin kexin sedolisin [Coprobacillus sp. CAG:698]